MWQAHTKDFMMSFTKCLEVRPRWPLRGRVGTTGDIEGLPAPSGDDQYARFREPSLHGFVRWIGELFSIKTPELRRQTIVAAMYGTFIKNEIEARKFWANVARGGEEYAENAPSTILDAWLKTMAEKRDSNVEVKPARISIKAASSRGMLIAMGSPSRRLSSTLGKAC